MKYCTLNGVEWNFLLKQNLFNIMKSYATTDAHRHQSPTSHTLHQSHTPHPHEVIHIDRLRPLQPVKRVGEPPNASTLFRGCWGVSRRLLWVTSYCTHFLKSPFECEATDGATNDKGDFLKSL